MQSTTTIIKENNINNISNESKKMRNDYIDWLKGFAIVLVVLGHCWSISSPTFWLIYRFHMPLFFCISGYMFKNNKKFKDFFVSKIKTLIIPYVIFFIISYILSITLLKSDISIKKGLIYMIKNGKYCCLVENWAIWYLPLFFIASNVFYFISKIKKKRILSIIIILFGILTVPLYGLLEQYTKDGYIPFSIQVFPAAIFFIGIGYIISKIDIIKWMNHKFIHTLIHKFTHIFIILLFMLGIYLSRRNYNQIISISSYRYLITALCIIPFVIYITKDNKNQVFVYLGKNSLIILGIHRIIIRLFEYYGVGKLLEKFNIGGDVSALIVTTLCITLIFIINELYKYILGMCKNVFNIIKNRNELVK